MNFINSAILEMENLNKKKKKGFEFLSRNSFSCYVVVRCFFAL